MTRRRVGVLLAGLAALTCQLDQSESTDVPPTVASTGTPGDVTDLAVAAATANSVTLSFTEVDDGTGQPASYDVRYAVAPISWGSAHSVTQGSCATPLRGTSVGARRTCTVLGLAPMTTYQFQLVAFHGTLNQDAVFGGLSNVAPRWRTARAEAAARPARPLS